MKVGTIIVAQSNYFFPVIFILFGFIFVALLGISLFPTPLINEKPLEFPYNQVIVKKQFHCSLQRNCSEIHGHPSGHNIVYNMSKPSWGE